jgi:hypothetical protein
MHIIEKKKVFYRCLNDHTRHTPNSTGEKEISYPLRSGVNELQLDRAAAVDVEI